MSRELLILANEQVRQRAIEWIRSAPSLTRVTFQGPKRSNEQNDAMWAMLTDISKQIEHAGRKYEPDDWKTLFMHALNQENRFAPALDGRGFVPLGFRSSKLSHAEMRELLELIKAWGAQNGVVFTAPKYRVAA